MKDSKSALRIKQLISIFIILIMLGMVVGQFKTYKREEQIAKENTQELNVDEQENIKIAQTTYEREFEVTSRSHIERLEDKKYISIEEITISKDMDLTKRCGISKEDFNKLMKDLKSDTSGFFEENSNIIYELCEKYEINEIFFCGLIVAESGWNIASSHRNTHNYISMMSNGKLIKYSSNEEGLEAAAKLLHNRYLTENGSCYNGKTLSGVKKCFCPNSSTWVNLVYNCMEQIIK